jgi:hypothetical protein
MSIPSVDIFAFDEDGFGPSLFVHSEVTDLIREVFPILGGPSTMSLALKITKSVQMT